MRLRRALAISRKQFQTLRHDPRSVALILVAPLFATLVFGVAFGTEVQHVPVVVVDHDAGGEAATLIGKLDPTLLDVRTSSFDTSARQQVLDAKAVAAIVFPANFTEGVTPRAGTPGSPGVGGVGATPGSPPQPPNGTQIEIFVDGTNSQQAAVVQKALANALRDYAASKGSAAPIQIATTAAYAKDARYIDYFVPGILGFFGLFLTTMLTLLAFVGERTNGTLDRLRVTPATEGEIVTGYAMTFGVVGAIQGTLMLSTALLFLHVLVVGNVLLAGLIVVLLAIDAQAIGILLSAAAQREGQAVQMIPLVILPTFLLSGIFVPVSSLPSWLRPFSWLLPPTWGIEALRDVMLRGWGVERLWLHLLVLVGFAVAFVTLAVVSLRRART